jgi:hypothetical protein
LKEGELSENSVVKDFFTTAAAGKQYKVGLDCPQTGDFYRQELSQ